MASFQINIIITAFLLLLMGITFLFFYLRAFQDEVDRSWALFLEKLNLRIDKIPYLLEISHSACKEDDCLSEWIDLKTKSRLMQKPGKEKEMIEIKISQRLENLWRLRKEESALSHDINFLNLNNQFQLLDREMEQKLGSYNGEVEKYNRFLRHIFIRIPARLLGYKDLPKFRYTSNP